MTMPGAMMSIEFPSPAANGPIIVLNLIGAPVRNLSTKSKSVLSTSSGFELPVGLRSVIWANVTPLVSSEFSRRTTLFPVEIDTRLSAPTTTGALGLFANVPLSRP